MTIATKPRTSAKNRRKPCQSGVSSIIPLNCAPGFSDIALGVSVPFVIYSRIPNACVQGTARFRDVPCNTWFAQAILSVKRLPIASATFSRVDSLMSSA